MRKFIGTAGLALAVGVTLAGAAAARPAAASSAAPPALGGFRAACPVARAGDARCFAIVASQLRLNRQTAMSGASPAATSITVAGWGARDIESAYRLPVTRNPHQTVAIVDAYDTPKLAAYLGVYRSHYGLPACTVASGCLRIVNQKGQVSPLPADGTGSGWDVETTLDADMVSAGCPTCKILVVMASDPSGASLAAAEDTAARLGATVISNSYGTRESGDAMSYASHYQHTGHMIVASAGDYGYTAAGFPANLAGVTAVGATALARTAGTSRGWTERVWNDPGIGAGGSGCSAYVAKPSWQHDTHCPGRTVGDVSAVGQAIAMYDRDWGGWLEVDGTSASAPLVAGTFALAGNAATVTPAWLYAHQKDFFFDVTAGTNDWWSETGGKACGYDYLCTAKKGYDAPTGVGTPNGVSGL